MTRRRRVVSYVDVRKRVVSMGPIYVALASVLRNLRARKNITQVELAQRVSLGRASIANIEAGRQRILLSDIFEFARALEVRPETLFRLIAKKAREQENA